MADNSGSTGILGVLVGAFIVVAIGVFFFGGFSGSGNVDVNIKPPISAPK
jgi:hypothetical protein